MKDKILVRQLELHEMIEAFNIVRYMYDEMLAQDYEKLILEMQNRNDYKMLGAFVNNELVGVVGYWIFVMLYCRRYIQISNLVVDPAYRNMGIGKKILDHVELIGKKFDCEQIVLDSYTQNKESHSLYFREGYHIRGFHFMKSLLN